jgi:FADH2 O2-dependent halogenase
VAATEHFDFVIFGSGFGGSILSMVLRNLGYSVLLLERGSHPRFVIGESSTPFANLLLERLAAEYHLPFLRSLAEWGTWQKEFPQIGCGLKRGFTFFHHQEGRPVDFGDRASQLLVAASPHDQVADTHWYRPDFDHFLVQQAQAIGVTYVDHAHIESCERDTGWKLCLRTQTATRNIHAVFAIDASGPRSFLSQHLKIPAADFQHYPRTHAIYAHFKNVPRLDQLTGFGSSVPPYPVDDAAVHHVFADGWIWVLRFNNGITSAGAALIGRLSGDPESNWNKLLDRFPSLRQQFNGATRTTPFYSIAELSFRRTRATGPDWALLPSAAGFVDPLLSTGFALNLLGISRLARAFATSKHPDLSAYERLSFTELDAAADLIGALYSKMNSFPEFAALSLLYFTAMSFTETAWRLGKEAQADLFLLSNNDVFRQISRDLCARARMGESISFSDVAHLVRPWDIAGLTEQRRNWYPVSFEDLLNSREKLGASQSEIEALIRQVIARTHGP